MPESSKVLLSDSELPALSPALDRSHLASEFARTGRIHISEVLVESAAKRLFHTLERETRWGLIFNDGNKVHEFQSISADDHQKFAQAAWERAHTQFQYFYHYHRLVEAPKSYPDPDHSLGRLVAFLQSQTFLEFVGEITGLANLFLYSSTATLFKPLDFLTYHDDGHVPGDNIIAYVLNLTPQWRPDWGGALQFYDRLDHLEEGYFPTFNALNLFRAPKRHSVSQVSSFGGVRYAISGWIVARD